MSEAAWVLQPGGGPRHDLRRGRGRPRAASRDVHPRRPDGGHAGGGLRPRGRPLVTGEAANRRAVSNPDRVAPGVQAPPGRPHAGDAGRRAARGHRAARRAAADVRREGHRDRGRHRRRDVVLTHPANWGPYRRELFEEVPQLAGLPQARMVTEPEAAAAHYAAARHLGDGDTVAVYDLGGGTFDATVLRKRAVGIEILGHPGGHRAARRRRLRRRHPRPHQLQLRRRAERAGHERPADGRRPGPAAPGLHRWPRRRSRSTPRRPSRCSCPTGTSTCASPAPSSRT